MRSKYLIQVDGSHIKGLTSVGITVIDSYKNIVLEYARLCGDGTCNTAEYDAVYWGLVIAQDMQLKEIKIQSDSNLVVQQICGNYQVYSEHLKRYRNKVLDKIFEFDRVFIHFKRREHNKNSDRLARSILQKHWKKLIKG